MFNWLSLDLATPAPYVQTPFPIIDEAIPKSNEFEVSPKLIIIEEDNKYNHTHTVSLSDGTVVFTESHSHPYADVIHQHTNPVEDIATSLSNWYQLNMGLIGIGALAVVAIIGSRNFFSNFLTESYPFGIDRGGYESQDPYSRSSFNEYDAGYGSFDRDSWYEDWYDQWYRENTGKPFEDEYNYNSYDRENYQRYNERYKRDLSHTNSGTKFGSSKGNVEGPWISLINNTSQLFLGGLRESVRPADKTLSHRNDNSAHCKFRLACEFLVLKRRQLDEDEIKMLQSFK